MVGKGLFVGLGPGGVLGTFKSPPSGSQVVQAGAAWGLGGEVGGVPEEGEGSITAAPRVGYGAYVGGGPQYTISQTLIKIGC
jgi:hypothetical protein